MKKPSDMFPCPFCRSPRVSVIGAARRFLHYRCGACEEVWTAMNAPAERPERASLPAIRPSRSLAKVTYH